MRSDSDLGVDNNPNDEKKREPIKKADNWDDLSFNYADDFGYSDDEKAHLLRDQPNRVYYTSSFSSSCGSNSSSSSISSFSCFGNEFYREKAKERRKAPRKTKCQRYKDIVKVINHGYYSQSNSQKKVIDSEQEQNILLNLLDTVKEPTVTNDEIITALISVATNLRGIASQVAAAAKMGWGSYCLSFFCCASSPVHYNELRLYILIDAALERAKQQNIIGEINLEQLSNPAVNRQLTMVV